MGSHFILLEKCKAGDGIRSTSSYSSGNICIGAGNNSYQQTAPSLPQQAHFFAASIPGFMVYNQHQSCFDDFHEFIQCRTAYDSRVSQSTPSYFDNCARIGHSHTMVGFQWLSRRTAAVLSVIRLGEEVTKLFGNELTPSEN